MASLRDGIYYTRMRVPPRFRHVDDRKEIWVSLGTGDKRDAELEEIKTRAALVADWEARAGIGGTPEEQFRRAATIAASRGFVYRTAPELAAEQLDEILTRVEAVPAGANPQEIAAILGGVEKPVVMLSGLMEYIESLDTTKKVNRFKNPEQVRLWRSPRLRAIENLRKSLKTAGRPDDMPVEFVTHDVARLHHLWWTKRLATEKRSVDTAEKDYANMSGLIRDYWDSVGKQSPKPYSGLSHRDRFKETRQKPEFGLDWIRDRIAAPGAMDGLNAEAQAILQIVVETGCRQSEVYNAPPGAIVLDAPIPYIAIEPEEGDEETRREIKNKHSIRKMPLVGIALEAATKFPAGFPSYRGNSNFSNTVNKWFRENKLFPTPGHTVGGLRHSFESRMKALGLENEDRGMLMGHSRKKIRGREVYGDELDLERRWCVATLIGVGPLVEGEERERMVRRLRTLLDEAKTEG